MSDDDSDAVSEVSDEGRMPVSRMTHYESDLAFIMQEIVPSELKASKPTPLPRPAPVLREDESISDDSDSSDDDEGGVSKDGTFSLASFFKNDEGDGRDGAF